MENTETVFDAEAAGVAEAEQTRKAKALGIQPPHILSQAAITNGMAIAEQIARVEKLGVVL